MPESIEVAGLHHGDVPIPTAARVGPLVASGGLLGMDPTDGVIPESLERQVELAFAKMAAVMTAAGGSVDDIVKVTCFVTDRGARDVINSSWLKMFPDEARRPARHMLTQPLPGHVLIQLEILGYVQNVSSGTSPI